MDVGSTLVEVWRNKPRSARRTRMRTSMPKYLDGGAARMNTLLRVYKRNETGAEPVQALWFRKHGGAFVESPP